MAVPGNQRMITNDDSDQLDDNIDENTIKKNYPEILLQPFNQVEVHSNTAEKTRINLSRLYSALSHTSVSC